MAAESNMNFQHGFFPSSFYNQHVVSFQSGAISSTAGMTPRGVNNSGGIVSAGGMILAGDPSTLNNTSSMIPPGNYAGSMTVEAVPGLKHDTGLAVDWSFNEQAILNDGLIKFADELNMMKYIKIAALLPEKNVRDVALRCRWMAKENGKRRKVEDNYAGKKIKDRRERMVDSSSKVNVHPIRSDDMAAYSSMMHPANHNNRVFCEVPGIDGPTHHLLEENTQAFSQITANLATYKIQDNVNLFYRTRDNITNILNSMSEMPGIMSLMPPLPVSIDEDLMNTMLSRTSQAFVFRTPSSMDLKREPRC